MAPNGAAVAVEPDRPGAVAMPLHGPDDDGGRSALTADLLLAVATVAAAVPIVVAAVRSAANGWLPVADDAYIAVRAHDVIGGPVPLLGTYSSASAQTHRLVNHPGPLQFDVAALPVRLFGPGWGTALATAGVNVIAIAVIALLARRLLGARAATLTMLFTVGLAWALGSETLFDPWNEHATIFPFLVLLFAAWLAGTGSGPALVLVAFAGSYVLQTHLSYALLVPAIVASASLWYGLSARRARRLGEPGRADLRWAIAGVVTLVVCWLQPLYQQVTGHPGNLTELVHAAGTRPANAPGVRGALQAVGGILGVPPFWLPPTWGSPPFHLDGSGRPLAVVTVALVALMAMGIGLAFLARRLEDRTTMIGLAIAGAAVAAALASTARSTSPFGLVATYVRWLWPISMFTWTVLIVAAVRVVRARGWAPLSDRFRSITVVGITVAVIATAALALPTTDHGTGTRPWGMPVTRQIIEQALPHLKDRGTVLVRLTATQPAFVVGPGLFFELQEHGIEFVTDDESIAASLGTSRRFDGTNAKLAITVLGGRAAESPQGGQRIAFVPALDRADRRTLRQLSREVEARLRELGGRVPVDRGALHRLPVLERRSADALARRANRGDLSALAELARNGQIERDQFSGVDLAKWADLTGRQSTRATALMLSPLPAS